MAALKPTLKWAQREDAVFLTIDLSVADDKSAKIDVTDEGIDFAAESSGKKYAFEFKWHKPIVKDDLKTKMGRVVELYLKKKEEGSWNNICEGKKLDYVKIDWNKWADSDDEGEDFDTSGMGGGMPPGMGGKGMGKGGMGGMGDMMGGMGGMPGMGGMGGMPGMGGMGGGGMPGMEGMDFSKLMAGMGGGAGGAGGMPGMEEMMKGMGGMGGMGDMMGGMGGGDSDDDDDLPDLDGPAGEEEEAAGGKGAPVVEAAPEASTAA